MLAMMRDDRTDTTKSHKLSSMTVDSSMPPIDQLETSHRVKRIIKKGTADVQPFKRIDQDLKQVNVYKNVLKNDSLS